MHFLQSFNAVTYKYAGGDVIKVRILTVNKLFTTINDLLIHQSQQVVEGIGSYQALGHSVCHHKGKIHCANIGDVGAHPGYYKLPAGGHNIVVGILFIVAQLYKTGNYNVIVTVLGEA